jgi:hypothetical protein
MHARIAQQDQVGQAAAVAEALAARHGGRRRQKAAADDEHPVHLTRAQLAQAG